MDALTLFLFATGLVLLVAGAESLVRGAARLAATMGISPLIIGLTVVAFGTSAPEMAIGVTASLQGNPDVAVGNVVGSNIFNVLFILGLAAVAAPLAVSERLLRQDLPVMIGASVLVLVMALDSRIGRWEGIVLFAGILAYTGWMIVMSHRESARVKTEYAAKFGEQVTSVREIVVDLLRIVVGLALLLLGCEWFVDGAIEIATALGVSELVIALTIVAGGTSAPELVTSVVASIRGQRDIAVGNIVGSNIFNILAVLGMSAAVSGTGVAVADAARAVDIPVMVAVALACFPVFFIGRTITRRDGAMFVVLYGVYVAYLILSAVDDDTSARASAANSTSLAIARAFGLA